MLERKHIEGQAAEVIRRCGDIPVYTSDFDILAQLTGFQLTRGVLCALRRPALAGVQEVCENARRIAILENVMNPTNVGAIFRSAAALNMTGGACRARRDGEQGFPWPIPCRMVEHPLEAMPRGTCRL